jgi:transcriptional regulator with AAA-type ATPase domain/tetratricopeptide (TPR) repeat protein
MHDPKRIEAAFQGGTRPREGNGKTLKHEEIRLGDLCLSVGNVTDALAYYKAALGKLGLDDASERLEVVLKASRCLRRQNKAEEALAFVEAVVDSFSCRNRRDLLAEKATLLCLLGRYGEASGVCDEVLAEDGNVEREKDAGIYLVLGHVLARLCKWDMAIENLEQAVTFSRMCGDLKTLGNALNNLGIVYKNLCKLDESVRFLKRAVRVAKRSRDEASLSVRLLNLANTLYKLGRIDQADKAVTECIKITTVLNIGRTGILASVCKARITKARGDIAAARGILDDLMIGLDKVDDPRACLIARETLAEVLAENGDLAEALDVLKGCLRDLTPHAKDVEAEIRSRLAEVYTALGRRARALEEACGAATIAEEIGDLYEAGRALRAKALASGPDGGWEGPLSRAEHIFTRIRAGLELGCTHYSKACLMGRAGGTAAGHLKKAITVFKGCGARRWQLKALCDLALVYAGNCRHEQAVTCLDEARAISVEDAVEAKMIARARARVDTQVARVLAAVDEARIDSVEAAFSYLASRLGADGMALADLSAGREPSIVETFQMSHGEALYLAKAVGAPGADPFVSTDIAALTGGTGTNPTFRSLLGVRLGWNGTGGLLVACWRDAREFAKGPGPAVSVLTRAYYEIRRVGQVFENALRPVAISWVPVCIAGMVTADPDLKDILFSLGRIAAGTAGVLINGETGTGKELVARAIHALSPRRDKPFVVQNCASLPEPLLESELFGHKAGAFTGARGEKRGLLETASGGTFFLDEVGDVSPAIQAKMLRAIESGEIRRVGDTVTRPVNTRFVSATNKDLEQEVEQGRFRRDLFYRLNVVSVTLPPLRDREGDVEILAELFLRRFASKMGKRIGGLSDAALRVLINYDWPGNVRQLENEMEKAVTLARPGELVTPEVLSTGITGGAPAGRPLTLKDELRAVERRRILAALRKCDWNKTHAARLLGDLSRPALIAKMKRLGIPLKKE